MGDDATVLKYMSLCTAYFDNRDMLRRQVRNWLDWPANIRERVTIVLCDDCSLDNPLSADEIEPLKDSGFDVMAFRIAPPKIPWNQDAARNICMAHAPEGWCLCTDMDHLLFPWEAERLFASDLIRGRAYTFARDEYGSRKPTHRHPNSWLIERSLFWAVGGMDESYRGHYWHTDKEFRDRLSRRAPIDDLPVKLTVVSRDIIADASTSIYARKEGRDKVAIKAINWRRKKAGPAAMLSDYERIL